MQSDEAVMVGDKESEASFSPLAQKIIKALRTGLDELVESLEESEKARKAETEEVNKFKKVLKIQLQQDNKLNQFIDMLEHVDEQYSGDHWATGECPRCIVEIFLGLRHPNAGGKTLEENEKIFQSMKR